MDNNGLNTETIINGQPVQQPIQQPNANLNMNLEEPVSIGSWLVNLLILMIPCVNVIMIFVWAFGSESKSKGNFFKAYLIWIAIIIVIEIVIMIAFGAAIAGMIGNMGNIENWNLMY